ncbi:MAG TPA: SDR family oxidoreductase [Gemmatimonadaceae bacterium]
MTRTAHDRRKRQVPCQTANSHTPTDGDQSSFPQDNTANKAAKAPCSRNPYSKGGAIVLTSSTAGLNGIGGPSRGGLGYAAAKHGIVGLMRSYANNLAPHSIRVNSVHPTGVNTPMIVNDAMQEFLAQDPALSNALANALPIDVLQPVDISNAVAWLVSDDARYVTGVTLPVDAGFTNKK